MKNPYWLYKGYQNGYSGLVSSFPSYTWERTCLKSFAFLSTLSPTKNRTKKTLDIFRLGYGIIQLTNKYIRPLAVSPLDYPECVPSPWGFRFSPSYPRPSSLQDLVTVIPAKAGIQCPCQYTTLSFLSYSCKSTYLKNFMVLQYPHGPVYLRSQFATSNRKKTAMAKKTIGYYPLKWVMNWVTTPAQQAAGQTFEDE